MSNYLTNLVARSGVARSGVARSEIAQSTPQIGTLQPRIPSRFEPRLPNQLGILPVNRVPPTESDTGEIGSAEIDTGGMDTGEIGDTSLQQPSLRPGRDRSSAVMQPFTQFAEAGQLYQADIQRASSPSFLSHQAPLLNSSANQLEPAKGRSPSPDPSPANAESPSPRILDRHSPAAFPAPPIEPQQSRLTVTPSEQGSTPERSIPGVSQSGQRAEPDQRPLQQPTTVREIHPELSPVTPAAKPVLQIAGIHPSDAQSPLQQVVQPARSPVSTSLALAVAAQVRVLQQKNQPLPAPVAAPPRPTIQVSIGRIEVRATPPAPLPPKPAAAPSGMSLEEYLRPLHKGGGR